jgi:hypothetical protein
MERNRNEKVPALDLCWWQLAHKNLVLNVAAVEFVPVSTGHPVSSRTAKNVSSGRPTARHSAVAANAMHSGIHCSYKQEVDGKETADPALFW